MEADSLDDISANDDGFCGCNLEAVKLAAKFDKKAASRLNPKPPMPSRVKGMENGEKIRFCVHLYDRRYATIINFPSLANFLRSD